MHAAQPPKRSGPCDWVPAQWSRNTSPFHLWPYSLQHQLPHSLPLMWWPGHRVCSLTGEEQFGFLSHCLESCQDVLWIFSRLWCELEIKLKCVQHENRGQKLACITIRHKIPQHTYTEIHPEIIKIACGTSLARLRKMCKGKYWWCDG